VITVETFDRLLLDLYRASRTLTMEDFQLHALERIKFEIPFEAAWWAMVTRTSNGRQHVHSPLVQGMPDDCTELLNLTGQSNFIAQTCSRSPGTCFHFGPEQLYSNLPTAMLAQHVDVSYVLCTASPESTTTQVSTFLSLSRRDKTSPFTESQRRLKERLMPHLMDMLEINRTLQITNIRAKAFQTRTAMAISDKLGVLHSSEPHFENLMRAEWADWRGPLLPSPLLKLLELKHADYLGAKLSVSAKRVGTLCLVTLTRRSPVEALTVRERAVAEGFVSGESYKEVARRLGLSPATVRHHLRSVYEKLRVHDKGALSKLWTEELDSDQ